MRSRRWRMAAALAMPAIAAVLVPAGLVGCDDDRRRHDTVIVAPQERHDDRDQDRRHEASKNERRDKQDHRDRD
jgi:hypothetical protein